MHGLDLTFETLGTTRNEAAVEVLVTALQDDDDRMRHRALKALMSRDEAPASQHVLANWQRLQTDDVRLLATKKSWMADTIDSALGGPDDGVPVAIEAAETLGLTAVISQIVSLAESSRRRDIRQRATRAILAMVAPLGEDARVDRGQPTVRGPVLARLADSVRRFSMHRNEQLVDAFISVSTWGDPDLRQMISKDGPAMELVCKRLAEASHEGVIDLLAGFVRRRNLHHRVGAIIQTRNDQAFRDALLRKVGVDPTGTVLRNLGRLGLPECCRGGEDLLAQLAPHSRAPLVHTYVAASRDNLETLNLIVATVERGGPGCETAAAIGLSKCEIPNIDVWMRAALPVADGDEIAIAGDDDAQLLKRLIDLLEHPDRALERGVRRVLGPLCAKEMLRRFESLRPRSRRRLGKVVMLIDPEAIDRVRNALRHPVLANRLEAIAMADALAAVDLLSDSFSHIVRQDHQEARIRAAEVMSTATGQTTLQLLRELTDLPECPVKDAALKAIQRRQTLAACSTNIPEPL